MPGSALSIPHPDRSKVMRQAKYTPGQIRIPPANRSVLAVMLPWQAVAVGIGAMLLGIVYRTFKLRQGCFPTSAVSEPPNS